MRDPTFEVKEGVPIEGVQYMTPKMIIVVGYFLMFCEKRDLPRAITNITEKFPQSVSTTHPDGRATDWSSKEWTIDDIEDAESYMEKVVGHLGAFSSKDLVQRVFVYHKVKGGAYHIHLQVSP